MSQYPLWVLAQTIRMCLLTNGKVQGSLGVKLGEERTNTRKNGVCLVDSLVQDDSLKRGKHFVCLS